MENSEKFAPFKGICGKICLNMPDNACWEWDHTRRVALITLEKQDAELVFYPLIKEFEDHRKFSSPSETESPIARTITSEFGLMPGQSFFLSNPIENIVLFVAWWPWGTAERVSIRVGLFRLKPETAPDCTESTCLKQWLNF
ncbi:MAG: hypothetical protein VR64_10660 [Desulfatitalea sp. BRH_c12]|nr:MAG: hypothetical protein VR64_10660 [Desulfatitalea sp. BRH_c12]